MSALLASALSGLLLQAVEDAEKIEQTPGYKLDMGEWHTPSPDGTCQVCMAGAVMAMRLGVDPACAAAPGNLPENVSDDASLTADRLLAINDMRGANLQCAARRLNIELTMGHADSLAAASNAIRETYDVGNAESEGLYRASWESYRKAAAILAEAGL